MRKSSLLILQIFLLSLVTSGCAQRMYDGWFRPSSEIAVLVPLSGLAMEVDGKEVSMHSSSVHLLEGKHTLKATVARGGVQVPGDDRERKDLEFLVKGGRTYHLKGSGLFQSCVWVVDAENGEIVSYDQRGCGRADLFSNSKQAENAIAVEPIE